VLLSPFSLSCHVKNKRHLFCVFILTLSKCDVNK
jgi:hypothetical protein